MPNVPSSVVGQKTSALSAPVVIASDQSPVPVSGSFTITPTGTQTVVGTVAITGTVTTAGGGGGGSGYAGQADNSVFTEGTTFFGVVGGEYTTSPGTLTSGDAGAAQVTKYRAVHVNLRDASGNELTVIPVSGTVTGLPSGTQTVAGTVTVNPLPTGTNTIGSVTVLPSGTQAISGTVTTVQSGTGTNVVSGTVTTVPTGTQTSLLATGTNTIGSVTVLPSGTQTVTGTVTTSPPDNASSNVAQFGGASVVTGTGLSGAGIPRVTVSSDSVITIIPSGTQVVSGTVTTSVVSTGTTSVSVAGPLGTQTSSLGVSVALPTDQYGYNNQTWNAMFVEQKFSDRNIQELQLLRLEALALMQMDPDRGYEIR